MPFRVNIKHFDGILHVLRLFRQYISYIVYCGSRCYIKYTPHQLYCGIRGFSGYKPMNYH
jgi:hypothetical protein